MPKIYPSLDARTIEMDRTWIVAPLVTEGKAKLLDRVQYVDVYHAINRIYDKAGIPSPDIYTGAEFIMQAKAWPHVNERYLAQVPSIFAGVSHAFLFLSEGMIDLERGFRDVFSKRFGYTILECLTAHEIYHPGHWGGSIGNLLVNRYVHSGKHYWLGKIGSVLAHHDELEADKLAVQLTSKAAYQAALSLQYDLLVSFQRNTLPLENELPLPMKQVLMRYEGTNAHPEFLDRVSHIEDGRSSINLIQIAQSLVEIITQRKLIKW